MKQKSFSILSIILIFLGLQLPAGLIAQHDHDHAHGCLPTLKTGDVDTPPSWGKIEASSADFAAPSVDVVFDQEQSGALLYHPVAAWTGSEAGKAQVSLAIWVKNKQASSITWSQVRFEYVQNGSTVTKTLNLSTAISPNQWKVYQNGRDYHQVGDVIYLNAPLPGSITVKLYFSGYSTPVTFTKSLVPYTQAYGMPFRAFDLADNEVWESASTHGGGSQVFAYDMGVQALVNGSWTALKPGTNGTQNSHFRVWGKPIYAMADGVVKGFLNNCPNNPAPGQQANWGIYTNGGAGNHFYIQHGENIALYAHMQPGTLNAALLQNGAVVKAGDFLGLAGNSGSSSGPHLHVHVRKETTIESGPFRPLIFNKGFAIAKTSFTSLSSNADWTTLNGKGLPGYASTRAFIWPGPQKPFYSTLIYDAVYRQGTGGYALWVGATSASLLSQDNTQKAGGMRMTDLNVVNVNGSVQYSGVWRPGSGVSQIQTGTTWAALGSQATTLHGQGYRLLDVEVFKDAGGTLKYAAVYGAGNWAQWLVGNLSKASFDAQYASYKAQGYQLIDVEVYKNGSALQYCGIFKAGAGNQQLVHATSWASFTSQWQTLSGQGLRLVDMDTEVLNGVTTYVGTFLAGNDGYALMETNWNGFISYYDHVMGRGLRLADFNVRTPTGSTTMDGFADDEKGDDEGEITELPADERSAATTENTMADVKLFPNPATDQFTISTDADIRSWMLINNQGRVIQYAESPAGNRLATVGVMDLPNGLYHVVVQTEKGRVTKAVEVVK